jgi:hypothetical protein
MACTLEPLRWTEQGEGANGSQGFFEVVYASWSRGRVMKHRQAAIRSAPYPMLADTRVLSARDAGLRKRWRGHPPSTFSTGGTSRAALGLFGGAAPCTSAPASSGTLRLRGRHSRSNR